MINWGIIGYGRMGKIFASCFDSSDKSFDLKGIASKSNFSSNQKIKTFKNYNDLINSSNIDALYISTLNNTHKDLVIRSLKQNKKVLCEKPLGLNFKEVNEIHNLIKDRKNVFFEAIAYRSHPQTKKLLEILKDQSLGKIKKIEANFGFKNKRIKKDSRLFNKALGGGSILDLGSYPISFFTLFVSKLDNIEIIKSNYNLCETDVDINAEIHLIAIDSDLFFTPDEDQKTFAMVKPFKDSIYYHELKSIHGHDAFLIENESMSEILTPLFHISKA